MNMPTSERFDLRAILEAANPPPDAGLRGREKTVLYRDIIAGTFLGDRRAAFAGKSVLVHTQSQLMSGFAMLELDGLAGRMVILPPDFTAERTELAMTQAQVQAIVRDDAKAKESIGDAETRVALAGLTAGGSDTDAAFETEWVLPTSGTTGAPKLVAHSLKGLLGAAQSRPAGEAPVWSTFYDIRRYGGLQIFLRAVTTGTTLVINEADEPLAEHVARMAAAGITHISGTPSHWRRLLMSGEAKHLSPRYVRLSGEIADGAILASLKAAFPQARIVHAYASTEAGVGFEVDDGREGFPASYLQGIGNVEMRVVDGSLRIRSPRTAHGYVGRDDLVVADADGFVDTDDMVELRGDRYHFLGRGAGIINVGGLKVHPEEVEQIINEHEIVRMSLVKARRSPVTGQLIVADVVLKTEVPDAACQSLREEMLAACRARLARHKVPVAINFVPALDLMASGKLNRRHA